MNYPSVAAAAAAVFTVADHFHADASEPYRAAAYALGWGDKDGSIWWNEVMDAIDTSPAFVPPPSTKEGKLVAPTMWFPAGTEVRDIRLPECDIQLLRDVLQGWLTTHKNDVMVDYLRDMLDMRALEPDVLNDLSA